MFKEPSFSFLLLSGIIFAVFQLLAKPLPSSESEIVVSEAQIKALALNFEKIWQRPPTNDESAELLQTYIREEILYREALAMGLDKNDGLIRRRLSQKMAFLSEDTASISTPSDQELQSYLQQNMHKYRHLARYSFQQIYFDTDTNSSSAEAKAAQRLKQLTSNIESQDTDIFSLSDPSMIKSEFQNESEIEIKRQLGTEFLTSLSGLKTNVWEGPIKSSYGLHLVRIAKKIDGRPAELDEVRDQLTRDWELQQQLQNNKAFYDKLRKRYTIKIDPYSPNNEKTLDLAIDGTSR